jgi:hypothetical protein
MSRQHLSCPACRIRVRADAPEIALLEDRCPICGATLNAVSCASDVIGFRCFDLDAFSDHLDAHRWSDDGGETIGQAVAQWQPRTR